MNYSNFVYNVRTWPSSQSQYDKSRLTGNAFTLGVVWGLIRSDVLQVVNFKTDDVFGMITSLESCIHIEMLWSLLTLMMIRWYMVFCAWCMIYRYTNQCWRIKDQLDVTCYFISLLMCSTCFGHEYIHHQELATILLNYHIGWSDIRVAGWSLQHGYHSNPTTPKFQHTSNQEQYDQCGNSAA